MVFDAAEYVKAQKKLNDISNLIRMFFLCRFPFPLTYSVASGWFALVLRQEKTKITVGEKWVCSKFIQLFSKNRLAKVLFLKG